MEVCKSKFNALRSHLAQGARQTKSGESVINYSMDAQINDLDNEARCLGSESPQEQGMT